MNIDDFNPQCTKCKHADKLYCTLGLNGDMGISDDKKNNLVKRGEYIFKENLYPNGLFAIIEGKVKISKIGEEGKEQIVRFAKSGDLIGYRALLSGEAYRASAVALSDTTICIVPKEAFLKILGENPRLSAEIIQKLAKDLRKSENRLLSISQKTVRERIAETLVLLHHEFGTTANEMIDVKLTRKEIGNIAGSTIETTIRTLSDFKKEGILNFDGKDIKVNNINKLIHIANMH